MGEKGTIRKAWSARPRWLGGWTIFYYLLAIAIVVLALIFHQNLAN
jgi:hypothetical protein